MRRSVMIIGLVAAFTLLAAACGGDDDDTGTTAATEGTGSPGRHHGGS